MKRILYFIMPATFLAIPLAYNACSPMEGAKISALGSQSPQPNLPGGPDGTDGNGNSDDYIPRNTPIDIPENFPKNAKLQALEVNSALHLGSMRCPGIEGGLEDGCSGLASFSGFTYDFVRHQMLFFGGGHATVMNNDVLVFDFEALEWKGSYTPNSCASHVAENIDTATGLFKDTGRPNSTHTYDLLLVSKTYGELLKFHQGALNGTVCGDGTLSDNKTVQFYDPDTKKWHADPGAQNRYDRYAASELDPVEDWSLIIGRSSLVIYDNVKRELLFEAGHGAGDLGYAQQLVYFPPTDKFYHFKGTDNLYEVTLNREAIKKKAETGVESDSYFTIKKLATQGDKPQYGNNTGFAYDNHNQLIGGGADDTTFYAFDPSNRTWYSQEMQGLSESGKPPNGLAYHAIDFDPVDGVYIFIDNNRHSWAYRW